MAQQTALAEACTHSESTSGQWGWYLYGITRRNGYVPVEAPGIDRAEALETLSQGDLIAFVSKVRVDELGAEAVHARLGDAKWLESKVRAHQRVLEAIHRGATVLPAKFGSVFPDTAELNDALGRWRESLLHQLDRLEGCDEWGVHLCADRSVVERGVAEKNATVRNLREQLASAAPGRAYLIRRQLAERLAVRTEEALFELADHAYQRLLRCAVAGELGPYPSGRPLAPDEVEMLRATFLVRTAGNAAFLEQLENCATGAGGLRCEYSGPWPPYSFATIASERRDD